MDKVAQEQQPTQPLSKVEELRSSLGLDSVPGHVAVIMDGNGRWGIGQGETREYGHRESIEALRAVVHAASDLGIKYLSLFCFSIENIERPPQEVQGLFDLFKEVLDHEPPELHKKNVRILTSGYVEYLPEPLPEKFTAARQLTQGNDGLQLNLCVMYSGRSELVDAAKRIAKDAASGALDPDQLDEEKFASYLFQAGMPDIDLVIRTSGEMRISNFLLWHMAYSEMYFSEVFWPDFNRQHFVGALLDYQQRNRRFGKV